MLLFIDLDDCFVSCKYKIQEKVHCCALTVANLCYYRHRSVQDGILSGVAQERWIDQLMILFNLPLLCIQAEHFLVSSTNKFFSVSLCDWNVEKNHLSRWKYVCLPLLWEVNYRELWVRYSHLSNSSAPDDDTMALDAASRLIFSQAGKQQGTAVKIWLSYRVNSEVCLFWCIFSSDKRPFICE